MTNANQTSPLTKLIPVCLSIISAVILGLAFPDHDIGWLAWIGFIPLLLAISGKNPTTGFFLSLICGMFFFNFSISWLMVVPGYKLLHQAILTPYMGMYFGIFGLAINLLAKRRSIGFAFVTAPFIWICLEYIRGNMGFMSLPWVFMAHSQYQYPWVIQIASITGTYGVSFVIIMVNAAAAYLLLAIIARKRALGSPSDQTPSIKRAISGLLITLLIMTSVLIYGFYSMRRPVSGKEIKVSVVQGNIEQSKKKDPAFSTYIMQTYSDLSRQADADDPDLIVWPEAATPGLILKRLDLMNQTVKLIREIKTCFLIGSSEFPKFEKQNTEKAKSANTALFFSPEGKVLDQYLKIRLLPFSEYVPYQNTIPWSFLMVPEMSNHLAGSEYVILKGPGYRFGTTICWESIFPDLTRQFVKNGAQFMVNIANEVWFGTSAGPYQFLTMNIFRAVENRIYLIRCVNTGVSCIIDPYGRVVERVKDETGKDLFVRGVLTRPITALGAGTFYTAFGDWFVWLSALIALLAVCLAVIKPLRGF